MARVIGEGIDPGEIFILEDVRELELDGPEDAEITDEQRRALARQLAERAKGEAARSPAPVQERRFGLAARVSRPKTAHEALEEARRAEEAKRRAADNERRRLLAVAAEQERRRRAEAEREAQEEREAAELAALERATFAPRPVGGCAVDEVVALIEGLVSGVDVLEVFREIPIAIVGPLWRAHGVRARHDEDLATALATDRLADALVDRADAVAAARVAFGGREWAVWCDVDREEVLAVLAPADLYLVGVADD